MNAARQARAAAGRAARACSGKGVPAGSGIQPVIMARTSGDRSSQVSTSTPARWPAIMARSSHTRASWKPLATVPERVARQPGQRPLLLLAALDQKAGDDERGQHAEQGEDHQRPGGIVAEMMRGPQQQEAAQMLGQPAGRPHHAGDPAVFWPEDAPDQPEDQQRHDQVAGGEMDPHPGFGRHEPGQQARRARRRPAANGTAASASPRHRPSAPGRGLGVLAAGSRLATMPLARRAGAVQCASLAGEARQAARIVCGMTEHCSIQASVTVRHAEPCQAEPALNEWPGTIGSLRAPAAACWRRWAGAAGTRPAAARRSAPAGRR